MRIKSYFDSSIPAAMRQARTEFGEDVMLVTSRIASPEFRYLGDYEVVFALEGCETPPENKDDSQLKTAVSAFSELMRQQFLPKEHDPEEPGHVISRLRATFIGLGIGSAQAEVLVALIQSCAPPRPETAIGLPESRSPKPVTALSVETGAIRVATGFAKPPVQPVVRPLPTRDEWEDPPMHTPPAPSRRPQNTPTSAKWDFTMMLVGLGFGRFRPVRMSE